MNKNKGITLIALVVTIVVLLILAVISIQAITNTGLFGKAKQATYESKYANATEKVAIAVNASYDETGKMNDEYLKENINKIDGLNKEVDIIKYDLKIVVDGFEFTISEYGNITGEKKEIAILPDNTKDTEAGTNVKIPNNWNSQNVKYIKTTDGTEVTTLETVATVYAVLDGQGNVIPIPKGFYYVGGNLDTGVVISDNSDDIYEKGKDKTLHDYATQLKGNQFVWIPCKVDEYNKYNWGYQTATSWNLKTSSAEKVQIKKYEGFYVARYEAGMGNASFNGINIGDSVNGWSNNCYAVSNATKESKPTSKAGEIPWFHSDYNTALEMSERMYDTEYVSSGLITGTQFDVMLNYISDESDKNQANASDNNKYLDLKTKSNWGNFVDTNLKNCTGKYCVVNGNDSTSAWINNTTGDNKQASVVILTTGSTNDVKKKNLYDVAGNLWEWTQEYCGGTGYMLRGGATFQSFNNYPASCRYGFDSKNTDVNLGYRVSLYIK